MPEKIPGAKEDKGKLQMSIVPPEIITAIAEVRRYGLTKYADPENWQRLNPSMLHEALLRHCVALWTDWTATDPESGLPHLWHLATNAAFLCWFYKNMEEPNELRKLLQSLCAHEGAEREKNGGWNEDFSEYAKARFGQEPVSNIEEYVKKLLERKEKEKDDEMGD